jgi:hypothetical protein
METVSIKVILKFHACSHASRRSAFADHTHSRTSKAFAYVDHAHSCASRSTAFHVRYMLPQYKCLKTAAARFFSKSGAFWIFSWLKNNTQQLYKP